jgi:XTP/dITP diphosphohydrolase
VPDWDENDENLPRGRQVPTDLLVATYNAGKLRELSQLLAALPVRLRSLSEFSHITEVDETGTTFAENAALKACAYSRQTDLLTLADDSGLEVDALGGAPGIFSARYAGLGATDETRRQRLLEELSGVGDDERRARFVCAIALARPGSNAADIFMGVCEGRIIRAAQGSGGFGYDPIFVPDGYEQTFGELAEEIKQIISHRARALAAARDHLAQQLGLSA